MEVKEIKAQTAFYKEYRQVFQYGQFSRTRQGWQVSDGKTTIAGVFHKLVNAAPGYEQLRIAGLKPQALYRVTSLAQAIRVGQFGSLLKHVVPVNINPNGLLLHTADSHITLKSGGVDLTLSGSALMQGILLPPAFRGTGYDEQQRTHADFGSDLFLIQEAAI